MCHACRVLRRQRRQTKNGKRREKFDATLFLFSLSLPLDRWNTAFVIILLLLKLLFCRMIEASGGPVLFCFILHCCSFIAYSRELERTHTHIHTILLILIENERQSIMNDSIFSVGYYSTQYVCFCIKFALCGFGTNCYMDT